MVGGGAAGMAAAAAAARTGAQTLLLERAEELGGVLDQCIHPGFGLHRYREELTGPEFFLRLQAEPSSSGAEVQRSCTVLQVDPDRPEVWVVSPGALLRIQPKAVVWAAGAWERPLGHLLLPGARPAGIFTAGLAQRFVNVHGFLPGKRALVLGSGDIGLIMARTLHLEGMEVVGVAEIKPYPGGLLRNVVQCLEDFGIPLFLRRTVAKVHGRGRLSGVTLVEVDEAGQPLPGTETFVPVDTLILSVGLIPEVRLLEGFLSVSLDWHVPTVNMHFQTELPRLFLAGNALVIFDLVDTVAKVGEEAGFSAAAYARGELPSGEGVPLRRGRGVAQVVPHLLPAAGRVSLFLRAARPFSEGLVRLNEAVAKPVRNVRPAEMVEVRLGPEELRELARRREVRVEVEPG